MGPGQLGWYVHLHKQNYLKLGTNPPDGSGSSGFSWLTNFHDSIYKQIQDTIKSTSTNTSESQRIALQNYFNAIKEEMRNNTDLGQKVKGAVEMSLQQELDDNLLKMDYTTGRVTERKQGIQFGQIGSLKNKTGGIDKKEWEKMMNTIDKIDKTLVNAANGINQTEMGKSLTEMQNAFDKIKTLKTFIDKMISKKQLKSLESFLQGTYHAGDENKNIIDILNQNNGGYVLRHLLNDWIGTYAAIPAIVYQEGMYEEYFLEICPYISEFSAVTNSNKAVNEVLSHLSSGRKIGHLTESSSLTSPQLQTFQEFYNDGSGVTITPSASQGKVDVLYQWDGADLGLSAKNINFDLAHYIHLVSGTNLLYMMQDSNTTNFLDFNNHYLNLFASHEDANTADGGFNNMKQLAYYNMQLILLYKAISGNTFNKSKLVDYLVINNKSNGKIYLVSLSTLIDIGVKAFEGRYLIINTSGLLKPDQSYSNDMVISSEKRGKEFESFTAPQKRILNLLTQVANTKISVSLNLHTVKDFLTE